MASKGTHVSTVHGRKPWTIVRRFDIKLLSAFTTPDWKVLGGSNLRHSAPFFMPFPMIILFDQKRNFQILVENLGLYA